MKQNSIYKYLIWVLFSAAIVYFKFFHHELWKDEWQAWFVASDQSWMEMFGFLNYEGHPSLWYVYLKLAALLEGFFELNPESLIQSAHALLVIGFAYLFFIRLQMPLLLKIVLALGYYFSFEYSIVNRGYAWVLLLAFFITHRLEQAEDDHWSLAIAIFLLCQTEVYGVFMAAGFYLYLAFANEGRPLSLNALLSKKKAFGALIAGVLVFAACVFPRGNRDDFSRAYNQDLFDVQTILDSFQGLLTNNFLIGIIPDTGRYGYTVLGLILAVVILASLVWIFKSNRKILLSFVSVFLMFFGFAVVIYNGGVRQWGMFYIFTICLFSLMSFKMEWKNPILWPIVIFGLFQMVHSFKSFHRDATQPFTNAPAAAEFITANVPKRVPIIALNKFEATSVIGYADRPFYELPKGEEFTYFKWLEKVYIPTESELQLFAEYKRIKGIVLISPTPIDQNRFPNAELWQAFRGNSFKQENYYLYRVLRN